MKKKVQLLVLALLVASVSAVFADEYMGEYQGRFKLGGDNQLFPCTAKVVVEGPGYYRVSISVADKNYNNGFGYSYEIFGIKQGKDVSLFGRSASNHWEGSISDGTIKAITSKNNYGQEMTLKKVIRKSPTLEKLPPDGAVVLLPYKKGKKTNVNAWITKGKFPANRLTKDGAIQMDKTGGFVSKQKFTDVHLHLEFMIPLQPGDFGQSRGNSGLFFNEMYEVQVLDSFGLVSAKGDCGAIYNKLSPTLNASLAPLQWQTYDIDFRAPRLNENGKVKERPRITVYHNGIRIHDDIEIPGRTKGKGPEVHAGPIHLQDHRNAVKFRNIWLVEKKE
jgi:hypothetical protein